MRRALSTAKTKKQKEKSVEQHLADEIKALRGVCIKLNPSWYIGIPDRLCAWITPAGVARIAFVELKRPIGGRLSIPQKMWKKMLTAAGAPYYMCCTKDEVDKLLRGEHGLQGEAAQRVRKAVGTQRGRSGRA